MHALCSIKLLSTRASVAAQAAAFGEGLAALLPQLQALTEILPPPTLAWKLQLLENGNKCAPGEGLTAERRLRLVHYL